MGSEGLAQPLGRGYLPYSWAVLTIATTFSRRDLGLDVVYRGDDVTAAGGQRVDAPPHLGGHLLGVPWGSTLWVSMAPQKA